MPKLETRGTWYQRSGAVTTIFAIVCQLKINNFLEKIRGTAFRESWDLFNKYIGPQTAINYMITIIAVYGALVCGYGDIIVKKAEQRYCQSGHIPSRTASLVH
jgi:hypothetical protein